MKPMRLTEEQIIGILMEAEAGLSAPNDLTTYNVRDY